MARAHGRHYFQIQTLSRSRNSRSRATTRCTPRSVSARRCRSHSRRELARRRHLPVPRRSALVRQGRIDDAAELVEFAARGVSAEPPPHLRAAILLAEATVATAKHDADVALERYEEALTVLQELDSQIDLSVARIGYARALRELAEYERAREVLELARESCLAMGATGLAAEVEKELALVGSRAG